MNKTDLNELIFMSFRYSLGRMTYVPSTFRNITKKHIKDISQKNLKLMIKEINESNDRNGLGMRMDIQPWLDFRDELKTYLEV